MARSLWSIGASCCISPRTLDHNVTVDMVVGTLMESVTVVSDSSIGSSHGTPEHRQVLEHCIDCGIVVPGGGFCRSCLSDRIRQLNEAYERVLDEASVSQGGEVKPTCEVQEEVRS